jgi:hypothetical protein
MEKSTNGEARPARRSDHTSHCASLQLAARPSPTPTLSGQILNVMSTGNRKRLGGRKADGEVGRRGARLHRVFGEQGYRSSTLHCVGSIWSGAFGRRQRRWYDGESALRER